MAAAKYSSQYISDRFLPDKAIDLIDEAGSRVRLRHIQLPEEARELDKELKQVGKAHRAGGWRCTACVQAHCSCVWIWCVLGGNPVRECLADTILQT